MKAYIISQIVFLLGICALWFVQARFVCKGVFTMVI